MKFSVPWIICIRFINFSASLQMSTKRMHCSGILNWVNKRWSEPVNLGVKYLKINQANKLIPNHPPKKNRGEIRPCLYLVQNEPAWSWKEEGRGCNMQWNGVTKKLTNTHTSLVNYARYPMHNKPFMQTARNWHFCILNLEVLSSLHCLF